MKKVDLKVNDITIVRDTDDGSLVNYLVLSFKNGIFGIEINCDDLTNDRSVWSNLNDSNYEIISIYRPSSIYQLIPKYIIKFKEEFELIYERKIEKVICTIDDVDYSESTLRSLIKKATA